MGDYYSHHLRVRYAECDAQGIVFNAHYLAYFDISITELWRAACGGYQAMLDRGIDVIVAEAHLRFHAPARFDDELRLEVAIDAPGRTSLPNRHRIWRGEHLLVEGSVRHVVIERESLSKTPIPDWLRSALAPYTLGDAL
jgi:acyl-CoA thioester hydrolase